MIDPKLIVFHSSPDFSDNSRALYDYVVNNTDYEPFWVASDRRIGEILAEQGVPCGYIEDEAVQEKIASAQFLVSASFEFARSKKLGQIHVSAWHGFGPKVVGFFDSASDSASFFELLDIMTTQNDIIAVTSRSSQIIISGMFATDPRKALVTGFARNDYMFSENGRAHLKALFGDEIARDDAKLVFYLPTMRKGLKAEGAQFEDNVFNYPDYDAETIDAFLEERNAYVVAKLHFADSGLVGIDEGSLPRRMLFLSNDDLIERQLTIYHLLNAFDALVTDYSSVYVDYMLLDRPIIFSCPDFDDYEADRGFIADDPRFMMPGAFVSTQREFLDELGKVLNGDDAFKERRDFMMPFFHTHRDGNSSERLFEAMLAALDSGVPDCHKDYASLYVLQDSPLSQYAIAAPFTGEVFFDCGEGYSEDNKLSFSYSLDKADDSGFVRFDFELPAKNVTSLRFDPDNSDRIVIEEAFLELDGKRIDPTWSNGVEVGERTVFEGDDPQIVFDSIDQSGGQRACIAFKGLDVFSDGARLLAETAAKPRRSMLGLLKSHRSSS